MATTADNDRIRCILAQAFTEPFLLPPGPRADMTDLLQQALALRDGHDGQVLLDQVKSVAWDVPEFATVHQIGRDWITANGGRAGRHLLDHILKAASVPDPESQETVMEACDRALLKCFYAEDPNTGYRGLYPAVAYCHTFGNPDA